MLFNLAKILDTRILEVKYDVLVQCYEITVKFSEGYYRFFLYH